MQATMYTLIDQKNSWIYNVGEIKYWRNKAYSTVHFFVLHFCLEKKSKLTKITMLFYPASDAYQTKKKQ